MKLVMQLTLTVLCFALAACSKSNQDVVIRSSGDLFTNGPGVSGNVHENNKIFFVLKNINDKQAYTLRVSIGQTQTLSSGLTKTVPDGKLSVDIYESQDAYLNSAPSIASAVSASSPYEYVYEAIFPAASSGDYFAVVSGESDSTPGIQFFFDIRVMSADKTGLTTFETTTIPAYSRVDTPLIIVPGFLNSFSGSSITPPGIYPVSLTSSSTTTLGYPQLFIYRDATLSLGGLLYTSYTTTADFIVTKFTVASDGTVTSSPLLLDPPGTLASGITITGVTFSEQGPFIVVKGIIGTPSYTLTVGP